MLDNTDMTARELCKQFVHQVLRDAGLGSSDPHKTYAARRLDEGETKYGPDAFRNRDPAAEGAEEGIDGANWFGFEFVKRLDTEDFTPEEQRLLNLAAQHGELMHEYARQYIELRDR